MNRDRFREITGRYAGLKIGIVGDFCLDRYLEIDPAKSELSLETGLPVHNVVRVRSQPGAAGTILNNLIALGVRQLHVVGFCGDDGEGFELQRCLSQLPGVNVEHFLATKLLRTFVYCKPLVMEAGKVPQELNRLDSKNWTPTPEFIQQELALRVRRLATNVDALILMDQVDLADTGVVTPTLCAAVAEAQSANPNLLVMADSRRGVGSFPPFGFKMNAAELSKVCGATADDLPQVKRLAGELASKNLQPVFVTLAERGIVGAMPKSSPEHVSAHPVRGPIDIVGAGDSVMANLTAALAGQADFVEAMELAMAAASLVIHQLGTTGTASPAAIESLLFSNSAAG